MELLPCPFCGSKAEIDGDDSIGFYVYCTASIINLHLPAGFVSYEVGKCRCTLGVHCQSDGEPDYWYKTKEEAALAWNTRL